MSSDNQKWKLNWRLLLLHFIGTWFIICSFETFSYLHNLDLLDELLKSKKSAQEVIEGRGSSAEELVSFVLWPSLSIMAGMLVSFLISFFVSRRNGWYSLSSIVLLAICYYVNRYRFIDWDILGYPVMRLGRYIAGTLILFIITGTITLIIGLLFFFSKPAKRFISNHKKREEANQHVELI